MKTRRLENYLRTHRKRSGLTQREVAFLLGCESGAKASRYERRRRQPGLETAFAYEAIFRNPASELFAGIYERAARAVERRAKRLMKQLRGQPDNKIRREKLKLLERITESDSDELHYEPIPPP